MTAIDPFTNKVIATVPIGQAPQAVAYVPNTVPDGDGTQNTQPLGLAGQATHITLVPVGAAKPADTAIAPTAVTLFNQGLLQVLQASVTGQQPKQPYILALSENLDGSACGRRFEVSLQLRSGDPARATDDAAEVPDLKPSFGSRVVRQGKRFCNH